MNTSNVSLKRTVFAAVACSTAFAASEPAAAWDQPYRLTPDASYAEGCFDMCMCPIWFAPMSGTFRIRPITITGTVDLYAVYGIQWSLLGAGTDITGEGLLTRFNEFATLNRLELDLAIGGDAPVHFDSGMVPAQAPWPKMNIEVAMNGVPSCYDIRIGVRARPRDTDINKDGVVNFDDLTSVINHWGECPRAVPSCTGDVAPEPTGDRRVNIDDLVSVLVDWG